MAEPQVTETIVAWWSRVRHLFRPLRCILAPEGGDLANAIDETFGYGTVNGVEVPYKSAYGDGDLDISLDRISIEVKSGNKMKLNQSDKNAAHSKSTGKDYYMYMPNATSVQIREAAKQGIIVIKNQSQMLNTIQNYIK